MFGVFVVAVAVDGFTLLGAQAWVSEVFNGGALVIAVAVSTLMGRRREARARAISVKHFAVDASAGKTSRGDPVAAAGPHE
jgi:ribose transport system permease protein